MLKKLALALVLLAGGFALYVSWIYQGAISHVAAGEKAVALTFDDGPNPPYTEELLQLLKERNVKANFFPKARNVEAFPEAARAIVQAGHEVGNHSYHHRSMGSLSSAEMRAEIERANEVLERVMGVKPRLFRPPYGVQSLGVKRALQQLDMVSVLASAHGSDWENVSAQEIAAEVLEGITPGTIILLHDGHGDVDDPLSQDSRAASIEATGMIIDRLREQGYRFVSLTELFTLWRE